MISLYQTLFGLYEETISQILVTDADLKGEQSSRAIHSTIEKLLELGLVPVINENDVVSPREEQLRDGAICCACMRASFLFFYCFKTVLNLLLAYC